MKDLKEKKSYRFVPWYATDEKFFDLEEGEEEDFISYISRKHHQAPAGEIPFPGSSWSTLLEGPISYKDDISDELLHEIILSKLYASELDASGVYVIVNQSSVLLSGTVQSERDILQAERVVKEIPAVWRVTNQLTMKELKN